MNNEKLNNRKYKDNTSKLIFGAAFYIGAGGGYSKEGQVIRHGIFVFYNPY